MIFVRVVGISYAFGLRGSESGFGFSLESIATSTLKDVHLAPSPGYNFANSASFGGIFHETY
jgi:hypothetical protein